MKKPHKRLIAWQKSMALVVTTYKLSSKFPAHEIYGLTAQMRRAAVAAPSNIAEGAANRTMPEFRNYLSIAIGTLNELDTQFEIANRIDYLDRDELAEAQDLIDECLAVTYGLRRSLKDQ